MVNPLPPNIPEYVLAKIMAGEGEGKRQQTRFWITKELYNHGFSEDAIVPYIFMFNINCKPPEQEAIVNTHLKALFSRPEHYLKKSEEDLQKQYNYEAPQEEQEEATNTGDTTELFYKNDFISLCQRVTENNPIYFDDSCMFWIWNSDRRCYERKDDTDIMTTFYDRLRIAALVNKKDTLITAMKMVGRMTRPQEKPTEWIQFQDFVIDITTGERFIASPDYFFINPLPHKLGKSTATPAIDRLFEQWVGKENIYKLKELCAYTLIADYPIHRIFILFGSGRNGKGSFERFVNKLVDQTNTCSTSLERLTDSRFEAANLFGKLVCFTGETNFTVLEETALLKSLCGQDLLAGEFKGKAPFYFTNYAKIIIATNSVPITLDKTEGFYSRMLVFDFPNRFDEGIDIVNTITEEEYENFMASSVETLIRLLKAGKFTNEGTIQDKADAYERRSNPLTRFIKEFCTVGVDESVPFWKFYDEYVTFLKQNGYRGQTKQEVGRLLKNEGFETAAKWWDNNGQDKQWITIFGFSLAPEKILHRYVSHISGVSHFQLQPIEKEYRVGSDSHDSHDSQNTVIIEPLTTYTMASDRSKDEPINENTIPVFDKNKEQYIINENTTTVDDSNYGGWSECPSCSSPHGYMKGSGCTKCGFESNGEVSEKD